MPASGESREAIAVDTVGGVAWQCYQHPNPPVGAKVLQHGSSAKEPHEAIADAVAARDAGYGDILPSTRLNTATAVIPPLPMPYVACAMDCVDRPQAFQKRRWPHWETFAKLWHQRQSPPLVFVGTRKPKWDVGQYAVDCIGDTTVEQATGVVQGAELLIGIDNGLSHVAGAVGTPALILYGPTTSVHNGPQAASLTALAHRITRCRACFRTPNWTQCSDPVCMKSISPDTVVDVAHRILERGGKSDVEATASEQVGARWAYAKREGVRPAQNIEELRGLWPYIEGLRPKRVMEIGSLRGGWMYFFSSVFAQDARLLILDIQPHAKRDHALDLLREEGKSADWLQADSTDPGLEDRIKAHFDHAPLDLLHIDGNHRRRFVLNDWNRFAPLVRPGGLVILHDTDPLRPRRVVHETVCELRRAGTGNVVRWTSIASDRDRKDRTGITIAMIGAGT